MLAFSAIVASGAFLIINGLIVFYQGILSDLIFRPLWVFLCSLMPILVFEKGVADSTNQDSRRKTSTLKG